MSSGNLAKVLHYYNLFSDEPEYKILCPFHEDVNASMKINLAQDNFYCFGCNVSGDAMKFVSLMNKKMDPLKVCIKYHKILRTKKVSKIKPKVYTKHKKIDVQALVIAQDYYYGLSKIDWRKEKGPEFEYMRQRGFSSYILNKIGAKINYNFSYPIIFPIIDLEEFKGWVCRTTNKVIEKKRKYLYNEGFSRESTLVGDYKSKVVILVEGYMDRLKFIQYGFKNVVAILGWKITAEQIKKLKIAGVKIIISALDTDKCGEDGTRILKNNFNVVRFQFPEGVKDPGDMNKKMFRQSYLQTKKLYKEALKNGFS